MRTFSRFILFLAVLVAAATAGATNASAATSYSGHARPLSVSAFGASVNVGDTGALPSSGGSQSASLTNLSVLGLATIGLLEGTTSGSGDQSASSASLARVSAPIVGLTAGLVRSQTTARCSGTTPSVSGSSELVNVTLLGFPIAAPTPNVAIRLPGGISVLLNEQTSSVNGNQGSITVNAIHVTGPGIDIVVASAESDITC
ncbi:MAG TPA: choice-of-anchor P family protein [Gaiellaceae bacterium]|nr:choice-of-anchor P family protein [Gaiellaceae bacterium]